MEQIEFTGFDSIKRIKPILNEQSFSNIFLVTGKNSYKKSGAEKILSSLLKQYKVTRFHDFRNLPNEKDVNAGITIFKKGNYDVVIGIGGGSVIDMAKLINTFAAQSFSPKDYVIHNKEIKNRGKILIIVPTTVGSGSESTHFAVMYIDKKKTSVAHKTIVPDYVILDPQFLLRLPPKVTASSGMDALSQAIESYWSVHATDESKMYAIKALKIILNTIAEVVRSPSMKSMESMLNAAHLAGKAINITKTTAAHAISYPLTYRYGIPHGHAVALTLGPVFIENSKVTADTILDPRGSAYLKKIIRELCRLFGVNDAQSVHKSIQELMEKINLETKLSKLGIERDKIDEIISEINVERLLNNPVKLGDKKLKEILLKIL